MDSTTFFSARFVSTEMIVAEIRHIIWDDFLVVERLLVAICADLEIVRESIRLGGLLEKLFKADAQDRGCVDK